MQQAKLSMDVAKHMPHFWTVREKDVSRPTSRTFFVKESFASPQTTLWTIQINEQRVQRPILAVLHLYTLVNMLAEPLAFFVFYSDITLYGRGKILPGFGLAEPDPLKPFCF